MDLEDLRRPKFKDRRERDEDRGNPNSKVQLPWFLYFDGKLRGDGQAYPLKEYEKRAEGWVSEFTDTRGLRLKLLSGLSGQLWKDAERAGLEDLKCADGWKELLRRAKESLLKQDVERQEELMLDYVQYPARDEREPMRDRIEDLNDAKHDFENSMGKEEGTVIPDQLHGMLTLHKAPISRQDQRQVQR